MWSVPIVTDLAQAADLRLDWDNEWGRRVHAVGANREAARLSGVKVGRVSKVSLERVGRVSVTLELSGEERPRTDASATISSLDFFGAKFVDYIPGSKDEFLPTTSVIVGTKSQELTDIAAGVATRANELLGSATGLVSDQLSTDIHNTLVATQRGMVALTEVTKGPLVTQSTNSLAAVERVMARLDTLLGSANVKGAGLRFDTLSANLQHLTGELSQSTRALNDLLGKVNRGEGTLGKLASDTLLYGNLNRTLAALTKLLDDLRERPGRYLTVKVF